MRSEKQLLLDEMKEQLQRSAGFVITNYQALKAPLIQELRLAMGKEQGKFQVIPKRVFAKAAQELGFEVSVKNLKEHIAVVYAYEDPVGTTKAVFDFANSNKKTLNILGGAIGEQYHSAEEMKKISKLPSQQQMRAMFVGILQAPMRKVLGVQHAAMKQVIYCIKNKVEKASEGES